MMDYYLIIKELMQYLERWKTMPIGIALSSSFVENVHDISVMADIAMLQEAEFTFFMFVPAKSAEKSAVALQEQSLETLAVDSLNDIYCAWKRQAVPVLSGAWGHFFEVARDLRAYKLIFLEPWEGLFCQDPVTFKKNLVRQMTYEKLQEYLQQKNFSGEVQHIVEQILNLPPLYRVHFVNGKKEGSLLQELLTCEGVGTLVHDARTSYHDVCIVSVQRVSEIMSVIDASIVCHEISSAPHAEAIAERIRAGECLALFIDGHIHACALYRLSPDQAYVRIEYLCSLLPYQEDEELIRELFAAVMEQYRTQHLDLPIVMELSKNVVWLGISPWFKRYGFTLCRQSQEVKNHIRVNDVSFPAWILGGRT